jgi:hypothetical protein
VLPSIVENLNKNNPGKEKELIMIIYINEQPLSEDL